MLLSVNWLKEFVPFKGTVAELADRLTMIGMEVEEEIRPFAHMEKVVVGHVVECEKHPEADKLSACMVDVGAGENLSIVCGAPNVAKGQKVAVALAGAELPGGLTIKKAKLRGVQSEGMICAEDELGLGEDHAGIMVLAPGLAVGTPLADALNLDTVVLDVGVTPNRPDCLSVLGLARETALAFGLPLTIPEPVVEESGEDANKDMAVEIADPDLCPAYRGRILENVSMQPAPAWMRYRLIAIGQRPINNIVDVTNYVMFELGQPLHAFDLDLLEGGKIRVAPATEGMKFTTLDDQERTLAAGDLLIWDGEKPVALAGVMGGANSEMGQSSSRVFLESAVFRPGTIRKTARRLALPSESSYRFERGVDQPGSVRAMNRAAALMAEVSGGVARPGVCKAEPAPWEKRTISFRPARARKLLGLPIDDDFCRQTITAMGCTVQEATDAWSVTAPSCRLDLEREVDVIEELGRIYGMDRIPTTLPHVCKLLEAVRTHVEDNEFAYWSMLKDWARSCGLREAVNYSFVGHKDLDALGADAEKRIPVMNPLTEEQNVLRPVLAPGLLHTLRQNTAQGNDRLRIFELAHVFWPDPESDTTAREPGRMGFLLHGPRYEEVWPRPGRTMEDADYLDLKALVENLCEFLHLQTPVCEMSKEPLPWLEPCVDVRLGGELLGTMGQVKPDIADAYEARRPVWLAELDVEALARLSRQASRSFKDLPTFPPSRRDVTIIAKESLPAAEPVKVVEGLNLALVENMTLVDLFMPPNQDAEPGQRERNLTYRLTFRHQKRTLKDKEVDKEMKKAADALTQKLDVRI